MVEHMYIMSHTPLSLVVLEPVYITICIISYIHASSMTVFTYNCLFCNVMWLCSVDLILSIFDITDYSVGKIASAKLFFTLIAVDYHYKKAFFSFKALEIIMIIVIAS